MSKKNDPQSNLNMDFYVSIIEQMPGLVVVMDKNSKFVYSNEYTAEMFGYSAADDMQGIDAYGMRCEAAKSASEFIEQDQYVLKKKKKLTVFDIHGYADGSVKTLLTKKSPLLVDGETEGTLCLCTEVHHNNISKISSALINSDSQYHKDKSSRSYTINVSMGTNELSKREKDCIFYLLRGFSMKEIARYLNISWRTVESYVNNIKFKWGCQNKKAVVDCAVANGFLNYIPENLLAVNLSHVLQEDDV